jgi:Ca-activated chloride channel homolog
MKALKTILSIVILALVAAYFAAPELRSLLSLGPTEMSYDEAAAEITDLAADINPTENWVRHRKALTGLKKKGLAATLPDISKFPLVVAPAARNNAANATTVEIFVSSEKAGQNTDGWMREAAIAFNQSNAQVSGGQRAQIAIRKIASGTGYQFIASGKHVPGGFSPSNHLWIEMAKAHNVPMAVVSDKLVSNSAGIVMKSDVAERLRKRYSTLDIPSLLDAVVQGELVMGYTNPFASSTGLNFLVTVLSQFAAGDANKLLDDAVVSAFESFQRGVPFIALTTLQMRESVQNDGSLDAFVMEHQTFARTAELANGYEFLPFGIVHDNPLYAVGNLSNAKREVLEQFGQFLSSSTWTQKATEFGFNQGPQHTNSYSLPQGPMLIQAQKLWKEKKDSGRPVVAVFLCDVSGSMRGERLAGVKAALRDGSDFIDQENSIGLVAFSNEVSKLLPIQKFNFNHKSTFHAAVDSLSAGGNTAMYDGVAVALDMLVNARAANPDAKPLLFVLSDGETNRGLALQDVKSAVSGLQIPVYTIGYEANLNELGRLSSLVEAATIDADAGEIRYKIGALLNAQM